MRLEVPITNCLTGNEEELEQRRYCKICDVRMLYKAFDRLFICPKCGDQIDENKVKPQARLVSTEGESVIVQPVSAKDETLDVPNSYRLIREDDV